MNFDFGSLKLTMDPIANFEAWMAEAEAAKVPEPTAMTLATASKDGRPAARVVLYKGMRELKGQVGFPIFTNYDSRKSRDIEENPQAALVFFWAPLGKQIRVEGRIQKLDDATSDEYFMTRPRGSRIGAWASPQSQPIKNRDELLEKVVRVEERFANDEVTRPPNWGGWILIPERIEFWQAGEFRLHDRFVFERDGASWKVTRLAP